MLITNAHAQDIEIVETVPQAPDAGEQFLWNMGLIVVLLIMFYLLLIRPQQKRFKEHSAMLAALKKGDKVITGGGLVGKIAKISDDSDEVVIDLGEGMKVTALRSTLQGKNDARLSAANDDKTDKNKKDKKEA